MSNEEKIIFDSKDLLFLIMKRFGVNKNILDDRFKLQKLIYLLGIFGVKLGYGFGWYRAGPYSKDIMDDNHHIFSRITDFERRTKESKWSENSIDSFKRFEKLCGKDILEDKLRLELITSIMFCITVWGYNDREEIVKRFKNQKRILSNGQILNDEDILKEFDFCELFLKESKKHKKEQKEREKTEKEKRDIENRMYYI